MSQEAETAKLGRVESALIRSYSQLRRFAAVAAPPEMAPDDLLHDALVRVLSVVPPERIDQPVPYAKQAIVRLASNERRRLGRRRTAIGRLESADSRSADDAYPSDLAHLAELSPLERVVLFAHYVDGDSFETIARQLNKPASSIRRTATRARRSWTDLNRNHT